MALIATTHSDVTRLLERVGFTVLETADPQDAALRADLVVLPFSNRPVAAPDWCRELRRTSLTLPVLVITRSDDEITTALAAGASDVLPHPLREDVLAARCRGWLAAGRIHAPVSRHRGPAELPERVLDSMPDPVVASDEQGNVVLFNRAAELITGYVASEVVGQLRERDLYASAADAARLSQELRRAPDHLVHQRPLRLRSRSGERIPVQVSAGLVRRASGEVVGQVAVLRDDRENQALAERLGRATEQLIAAEGRAEAARSANLAACELNQPLTAVMGMVELMLMRPEFSGASRDKLERSYAQLERMADLVKGIARATSSPSPSEPL